MNAEVCRCLTEIEPLRVDLPEVAWAQLRLRLSHGSATGEAQDVSLRYGADPKLVTALLEVWCFELELEPWHGFELEIERQLWRFQHSRAVEPQALPLLLLHGFSGSPQEFDDLVPELVGPSARGPTFHVVRPALPGFGLSQPLTDAREVARGCATLMERLGYQRYLVHGSDLGANIALELAAVAPRHVAGLHITHVPTYPGELPEDVAALTTREKSQLARLRELHDELGFGLPQSPIEALGYAIAAFDQPEKWLCSQRKCHQLLTGLTLAWAAGAQMANERSVLYRGARLATAPASGIPIALHDFPLGTPTLRRLAERAHRIAEWHEHESGGAAPAWEAAELWLSSLRSFAARAA